MLFIQNNIFKIYLLSVLTLMLIPTNGGIDLNGHYFGFRGDHIIHSSVFFPFTILFSFHLFRRKKSFPLFLFFLISFAFAAFFESLHLLLPYRTFSVFDFFANCIGITFGYLLLLLGRKIRILNIQF